MAGNAEADDRQQTMPPILLHKVEPGVARYQQRKRNALDYAGSECLARCANRAAEPIVLVVILQSVPEFPHPVPIDDRACGAAHQASGHRGADAQQGQRL